MKASLLPTLPVSTSVHRFMAKNNLAPRLETPALRNALSQEVESVYWQHTLTAEALQVSPSAEVKEIVVLEIKLKALKTPPISLDLLTALDELIPYHTIFLLYHGDTVHVAMAFKSPDPKRPGYLQGSQLFFSAPKTTEELSNFLPFRGLTLASVYESALCSVVGHDHLFRRSGESLADAVSRAEELERLEAEHARVWKRMLAEKQPARKQTIYLQVQTLSAKIKILRRKT